MAFPSVGTPKQSVPQAMVESYSDSFFGLLFAAELALQLLASGPRRFYSNFQGLAELVVVMAFGFQTGVSASGGSLPFNPFLLRLLRLVRQNEASYLPKGFQIFRVARFYYFSIVSLHFCSILNKCTCLKI